MLNRGGNIVITRGTLGQIGSFLAGIGFLSAILSFLWLNSFSIYVLISAIVSIVGIVLWAYMTPEDFRNFIMGRQAKKGTIAFFTTLLLTGIVALIYIYVGRAAITIDMTQGERFTLSPESLDVLEAADRTIEAKIRITGFYTPRQVKAREVDNQYWELYADASNKITIEYIDPLAEPARAAPYSGFLEQGVNVFVAYEDDNSNVIFQSTIPVILSGKQERDMTEALTRLLVRGRFRVYFESSLDTLSGVDNTAEGISIVNNLLRTNGIETQALSLAELAESGSTIPADASAVVFARPGRQLSQAEIDVVDEYVQRGGALFILTDVVLDSEDFLASNSLFNTYLWETFGLRGIDAIVVDEASSQQTSTDVVSAAVFPGNPVGVNLNDPENPSSNTLFRLARPIEVDESPPVNNGKVILTSPFSWAETDIERLIRDNAYEFNEGDDIQGPVTTVAWANDQVTNAKLVIVGDTDFITNGQVLSPEGNSILFFDSIGWMTGFTEDVRFEPQIITTGLPIIFVDVQTLDLIAFITTILMPGAMLALAIIIWGRRLR